LGEDREPLQFDDMPFEPGAAGDARARAVHEAFTARRARPAMA